MKKAQINDISMAYERRGAGPALLLVHGFPLDHSTWEPISNLLDPDFDLILPDLRGFGQTTATPGAYTLAQMAADLAGLLDELNIHQTFIVGHSMGGYISLAFARAYPARVLGLGLVGSQAAADSAERKAGRYATARQVEEEGPSAVAGMAEKLSANPQLEAYFRKVIQQQNPLGLAGALQAMAERPDGSQTLASCKFPVVLVHGLADALIPPERAREIKALLPQAMLTELPGVGHTAALEAPGETARALRELLRMS